MMVLKNTGQHTNSSNSSYITAYYLTEVLTGPDGDDKLLPSTTLEDPCSAEFAPEVGSTDATAP
jgi:hypothetical protein